MKEENKKSGKKGDGDNDDNALDEDDALLMFAKGSRDKKKK